MDFDYGQLDTSINTFDHISEQKVWIVLFF